MARASSNFLIADFAKESVIFRRRIKHAYGHDAHTAMLMGAAEVLAGLSNGAGSCRERHADYHGSSTTDEQIERAAAALREADALLVCAGAGMGVDSGLPDFRGTEGFWRAYPAIAKLGLSVEEMANPAWCESDPHLAWAFYGHRLDLYRRTNPHRGFAHLLQLGSRKTHGCWVFTSNVDGHFQKAGFAPERIVECHGSIPA